MSPTTRLGKQYMSSSSSSSTKEAAIPRPSASILLISPLNEILLLHRVQTSSSFPSAHVFPGGNLSTQDGVIPDTHAEERHRDGLAYRVGAIRECFEESGILLARPKKGAADLLDLKEEVLETGRRKIHDREISFTTWVAEKDGIVDTEGLIPFTRWVTPTNLPKRFTTQMYLYFLPLSSDYATSLPSETVIPKPTSDGGIEHTAASFSSCATWLTKARANEIILFPPQYYLMHLLAPFLTCNTKSRNELQRQRNQVMEYLRGDGGDGSGVVWSEKVMSPTGLMMRKSDGRSVLGLDKPGPELKDSGRVGDRKRVVLVKFSKEGPRDVEVKERSEVLEEERQHKEKL